jgi:hypothetical protein
MPSFSASWARLRRADSFFKEKKARLVARLKQLAEKVEFACSGWEKHPSGAKACADIAVIAARLKPCPFKTAAQQEFFRSL